MFCKQAVKTNRLRYYAYIISLLIIITAVGTAILYLPSQDNLSEETAALSDIPEYDGSPSVELNGNKPAFTEEEIKKEFFEAYSDLDDLGRCGAAMACLDEEHMPFGERGSLETVKPTGWQTDRYDFIDNGGFVYNRCHLIGWQLTGQNDEPRNLITGTRYMNTEGMLPYENRVASYVRTTGEHVMYRITPVFAGNELLARGVRMEAYSVEDGGVGLSFHVFCYNIQPGVEIDYRTGENRRAAP